MIVVPPKPLNLVCFIIGFASFVLNLAANCSSNWWVARVPQEFERIGLWEICFNHYRHRFDYYGKIYTGCWWHFSPETTMLFSWISTPWYRVVQAFASLSMIFMLFAFILQIILTIKPIGKISSRYVLLTAGFTLTSALFMAIAVITFGVRGKDRNWMPRFQQNWFGWSFTVAIITCLLEFISGQ